MTTAILQSFAAALASAAIFPAWRRITAASRPIHRIVTTGLLLRVIGGQLAFWISWLSLPIARPLQLGDGLWIFALDGKVYSVYAAAAARTGLIPVLFMNRAISSVSFVQILAAAMLLFGIVTSVAILINAAAYLGCCSMVLRLGRSPNDRDVVVAIAAISLMPSAIVWSLQPLKDLLFLFLLASFFAAAGAWQEIWRRKDTAASQRMLHAALCAAVLFATLYGIAGIRWYFGMVIVVVSTLFLLLVTAGAPSGLRLWTAAHSALLLVLLAAAFYVSARPLLPGPVRETVEARGPIRAIVPSMIRKIRDSRAAFDRTDAGTLIGVGIAESEVTASRRAGAGYVTLPSNPAARLAVGCAALLVPRFLGERLGIFDVRGGHGLWLVAEIDTIGFDLLLGIVIVSIVRAVRGGGHPTPLFWMILIVTAVIGAALVYTVSNFGTLFRHRDMVLLGLVFLPLAMASAREAAGPLQAT